MACSLGDFGQNYFGYNARLTQMSKLISYSVRSDEKPARLYIKETFFFKAGKNPMFFRFLCDSNLFTSYTTEDGSAKEGEEIIRSSSNFYCIQMTNLG